MKDFLCHLVGERIQADLHNKLPTPKKHTAWYIPPSWIPKDQPPPKHILAAALAASQAAPFRARPPACLFQHPAAAAAPDGSRPPGSTLGSPTSSPGSSGGFGMPWILLTARPLAYFFWDDEGVAMFMDEYGREFVGGFDGVFTPVERADVFRVLTCQYLGGLYADIDTQPLRPPAAWIDPSDLAPWVDEITGKSYGPKQSLHDATTTDTRPVNLIWGARSRTQIQTQTPTWRMGLHAPRRGPAAVTLATMQWLERDVGFRWNSLTGLRDGGRSKLVQDALILPITGFSPGRGTYGNMGSKPVTHPDARLVHHALGSWKRFDWLVEYGKFCRTVFGLCRDWTKVPVSRPRVVS
ncbi:glycosyltransferase family 32 protein [Trichoderma novae-zelandiae]